MSKIKKVIILDAGGVLHADSHFCSSNQAELKSLTGLSDTELDQLQNHSLLNNGEQSLRSVLENVLEASPNKKIHNIEMLLKAYKNGIVLYPGAQEMIYELYKAGYQVVLCTNNSDLGVQHTRELLAKEGLSCVKVYGSSELRIPKPDPTIFLKVCELEKVTPEECWFVDDREENCQAAESLGISVIPVERPDELKNSARVINSCRDKFIELGIMVEVG